MLGNVPSPLSLDRIFNPSRPARAALAAKEAVETGGDSPVR